jgi:hypothetical protein
MDEDLRKEAISVLTDVAQLISGWHADIVWSEWDESVRKRVSELLHKFYAPLSKDNI